MSLFGDTDFLLVYKQWGKIISVKYGTVINLPTAFNSVDFSVIISDISDTNDDILAAFSTGEFTRYSFVVKAKGIDNNITNLYAYWCAIGF